LIRLYYLSLQEHYQGMSPEEFAAERLRKQNEKVLQARLDRMKQLDKRYINSVQMRSQRIMALNNLMEPDQARKLLQNSQVKQKQCARGCCCLQGDKVSAFRLAFAFPFLFWVFGSCWRMNLISHS
jgi:hypothetical protein